MVFLLLAGWNVNPVPVGGILANCYHVVNIEGFYFELRHFSVHY
jgi:hypothetical protein